VRQRDEAPAWLEEIVSSADVQRVMDERRDALRVEWRRSAGKGEQGAGRNKSSDTGLTMTGPRRRRLNSAAEQDDLMPLCTPGKRLQSALQVLQVLTSRARTSYLLSRSR
jgi:hypothetical protein